HAPIAGSRDEYADGLRDWMTAHPSIVPFLGSVGGQDVGMAWLVLVPRVPDPRSFDRLTGDIQSVYVLPDHRDAGLGARLVDAALAHARGAGCFRVTVHAQPAAASLYERAGFAVRRELMLTPLDRTRPPGGP
ncbi:GNAT family N-acetyltransferase, partial [Phycicoccus flavus]